jgi:hypothetical protein
VSTALQLHRWRRLDWRWLLPVPEVGDVVLAGPADALLVDALPLLGSSVHRVERREDWSAVAGSADLVVLVQPGDADLRGAVAALRPGGWVYAEVRRDLRAPRGRRTLLGHRAALRRAGLVDVTAHWHAPDFASCSRIVALEDRTVVRDALGRHQVVRFGAALSLAGRTALRLGLFPLAVREGSLVGRRP